MNDFEAGCLEHFLRGLLHVFGHAVLVVAKLVVEPQSRNSPLVLYFGIEIDVIRILRPDFPECPHADGRSLILPNFFFEACAESGPIGACRKHAAARAALKAVTTNEFRVFLFQIAETGEIEAAGPSIIERWG